MTEVKICFDCKMFDVANWVACLNGENDLGGTPSHEAPSKVQGPVSKPNSVGCYGLLNSSSQTRRNSIRDMRSPVEDHDMMSSLSHDIKSQTHSRASECDGYGLLNSSSLHKQTRRNSIRDVRSPVEDHDMVSSLSHDIKSQTHSRASECDGRPPVQIEPSAVNRMVTASAGVQTDLSKVVHSCGSICLSSEPQTSTVRVSSPRPKCLGHRCSEHKLDELRLPSNGSPSQGDQKNKAMPLPDHPNSPRLARDALVLGPSAALNRDPTATSSVNNSFQTVPQLCVPQESITSQPPRLVSWSGQLQKQGFSVEVAKRIAAPQRSSTMTIYKSKRAQFEKWCRENSVDFSTPYVKQISDFFIYLYQDLNRYPSTIDGYRTAIVDTLGPAEHHITQSSDLHMLLSSFHRDRPKSSRNLPKWNLSVVLNELTKAPFEPMKDTDLKHLTLKSAFLLALASSKRCSEIHAWVTKYLI